MRVFISWSKEASKRFAEALKSWLQDLIQEVRPWMSDEDIQKGQRWNEEVLRQLQIADEGIICVTRDNQHEPWLNFEAGALAKSSKGSVRPILLDLEPADLVGPLTSFQLSKATDMQDMKKLAHSLNKSCSEPQDDSLLMRQFERTYDDFLKKLGDIGSVENELAERRSPEDMIAEVVQVVRGLERGILTILERGIRQSGVHPLELSDLNWLSWSHHKLVGLGPQVALLQARGLIAMRDAKDIAKLPHIFTIDEWLQFIEGVKNGEYDFTGRVDRT